MGDVPGTKVWVGNLGSTCEERDLRDEFSKFGELNKVWVARNPPGFAFVWFADDRDAGDAVREIDGKSIAGREWRVEVSHQRGRDRGPPGGGYGGGGGGGGYGGGGGGGGGGYGAPRVGGAAPRTGYKVRITGLPEGMRWSELKDFVRKAGDVTYADVRGDEGVAEFSNRDDMSRAVRELDDTYFADRRIRVDYDDGGSGRGRSRSPVRRRSRSPPPRRGSPPRGRSRSPPGRGRSPYGRSRSRSPVRDRY
ncbi:unnamed protein product [Ectocarpus sp. 4 AP-2014]